MALIINPNGSEVRGSIGSNTYARNRYGAYIRARAIPVNPRTTAQIAARQCMQQVSTCWRSLTGAQQSAWNEAANNFPITNKVGQTVYLSGQALFVRLNCVRLAIGKTITAATPSPADFAVLGLSDFNLSQVDTGTIEISTVGTLSASFFLKLEATACKSPGVSFIKRSDWKCLAYLDSTSLPGPDTTYNAYSVYSARFSTPVENQKLFLRLSAIYEPTGEMLVTWQGSSIVSP